MRVILVPAINMKTVITIIIYGVENAAIPLLRVENPPVDKVENEWQIASKNGIPPRTSKTTSEKVSKK
jgi:uncharacterized protein (UPF0218 family)